MLKVALKVKFLGMRIKTTTMILKVSLAKTMYKDLMKKILQKVVKSKDLSLNPFSAKIKSLNKVKIENQCKIVYFQKIHISGENNNLPNNLQKKQLQLRIWMTLLLMKI